MQDCLRSIKSLVLSLGKPDNAAEKNCNKNTHNVSGTNVKGMKNNNIILSVSNECQKQM